MLEFDFTVNKSFLNPEDRHPEITVPRSQVDYSELCNQGLDEGELTIMFPRGERISGKMRSSRAKWGPYYQIRANQKLSIPGYLRIGDKVKVSLSRDSSSKFATIEYTNSEL